MQARPHRSYSLYVMSLIFLILMLSRFFLGSQDNQIWADTSERLSSINTLKSKTVASQSSPAAQTQGRLKDSLTKQNSPETSIDFSKPIDITGQWQITPKPPHISSVPYINQANAVQFLKKSKKMSHQWYLSNNLGIPEKQMPADPSLNDINTSKAYYLYVEEKLTQSVSGQSLFMARKNTHIMTIKSNNLAHKLNHLFQNASNPNDASRQYQTQWHIKKILYHQGKIVKTWYWIVSSAGQLLDEAIFLQGNKLRSANAYEGEKPTEQYYFISSDEKWADLPLISLQWINDFVNSSWAKQVPYLSIPPFSLAKLQLKQNLSYGQQFLFSTASEDLTNHTKDSVTYQRAQSGQLRAITIEDSLIGGVFNPVLSSAFLKKSPKKNSPMFFWQYWLEGNNYLSDETLRKQQLLRYWHYNQKRQILKYQIFQGKKMINSSVYHYDRQFHLQYFSQNNFVLHTKDERFYRQEKLIRELIFKNDEIQSYRKLYYNKQGQLWNYIQSQNGQYIDVLINYRNDQKRNEKIYINHQLRKIQWYNKGKLSKVDYYREGEKIGTVSGKQLKDVVLTQIDQLANAFS